MSITTKRRLKCNAFRQIILNNKMLSVISNQMFHKLTGSLKIKHSKESSYLTRGILCKAITQNSFDRNPISEMKMRWLKIKIQTTLRLKMLTVSSLLKKTLKVRKN